ncbi:MAG: hypothetical protein JJT89_16090 [Nitriliruptoraceae bacterium]|nr:hypothetical protein [Nitriliruptoraceae bacterium]
MDGTIDITMIDPVWWIVLGVVVVVLGALLIWWARRRAYRSERLRGQFRSEYDRTTSATGRKEAEADLERRTARRGEVELSDLDADDAERLQHDLDELLRSFVDGPRGAALGMAQQVGRVAAARGYLATEGSVLDLVSVDHPEQVAALRRSEAAMERASGADLTEASRQTILDARALTHRLLAEGRAGHLEVQGLERPPAAPQDRTATQDPTSTQDNPPAPASQARSDPPPTRQPMSDAPADPPPPPAPDREDPSVG